MLAKFLEEYFKAVTEKTESENTSFEDNLEAILVLFDQGCFFF